MYWVSFLLLGSIVFKVHRHITIFAGYKNPLTVSNLAGIKVFVRNCFTSRETSMKKNAAFTPNGVAFARSHQESYLCLA